MSEHPTRIHPTAVVDAGALLGQGVAIWHFVHVDAGAQIGANTSIGQGCYIAAVVIGSGCKIQNNVSIYQGVTIGDDVFLGPSCVFTNVRTPRAAINRKNQYCATVVHNGATIGANATIVCRDKLEIGSYAMIGAGAVVTTSVAAHAIVVGSPARKIGWACRCGERLSTQDDRRWQCAHCQLAYVFEHGHLTFDDHSGAAEK